MPKLSSKASYTSPWLLRYSGLLLLSHFVLAQLLSSCSEPKMESDKKLEVRPLLRSAGTDLIIQGGDTLHPYTTQVGGIIPTGVPLNIPGEVQKASEAPALIKRPQVRFLHYANGLKKLSAPSLIGEVELSSKLQKTPRDTLILRFSSQKVRLSQISEVSASKVETESPFRIRRFDMNGGLLDDFTSRPVKDDQGVLWYMNDAIMSFDGRQLREYLPESGLLSISSRFLSDENGNLWFRTDWSGNLKYFDGHKLHSSNFKGSPIGNDAEGRLYIAKEKMLYRLEDSTLVPIASIPNNRHDFRSCFTNSKGELLINSFDDRWFSYANNRLTTYHLHAAGKISSIIEGRKDDYWIAAENGVFHYETSTGEVKRYDQSCGLSNKTPLELMMDRSGGIWISYQGGGVDLIAEEGLYSFEFDVSNNPIGTSYIKNDLRFLEDDNGQIWLSTSAGFVVLDKSLITNLEIGLEDTDRIKDIAKDKGGNFWILSFHGVYKYDPRNQSVFKLEAIEELPVEQMGLLACKGDELWIGPKVWGEPFLAKLSEDSLTLYRAPQGLSTDGWSDMEFDDQGTLWLGGHNGLFSFDGKQFTNRLKGIDGHVNTLSIDSQGKLILAHNPLGIVRYDRYWNITSYREGLKSMTWHVQSPSAGTRIIGTWTNGCQFIFDTSLVQLDVFNGLSNNYIGGTATDPKGVTWLTSNVGLNAFRNSDLQNIITGKAWDLNIDRFGMLDGLNHGAFDQNWNELFHENYMYIRSGKALLKVDFEKYSEGLPQAPIILTELKVNEQSFDFQIDTAYSGINYQVAQAFSNIPRNLRLAHDQNHLTFFFRELNYRSPNKSKYRYRITELDSRWTDGAALNQADFRDLPAGDFTFEVQSLSDGFDWSASFYYPFKIQPAWYHSSWAYGVYLLALLGLIYLVVRWRTSKLAKDNLKLERIVNQRTFDLSEEKRKSEDLLLNILPSEVADELKEKGQAEAKLFEETSVMFTDFMAFTAISERLSPSELVAEINHCFKAFDGIMEKYGIEKIKTIGDAYMAAGGLNSPKISQPKDVILAALDMQVFMKARKMEQDKKGLPAFEMRLGIHTGPVVAGIVGVKKFQYDIWGDTVNTASRMESSGEVGKVNISQATYDLLKNDPQLSFESRGMIEVKGKGALEMWFVSKLK